MPSDNELHKACNKGDLDEVRRWVDDPPEDEEAIDVDCAGASNRRPLQRAAGAGHINICEFLLSRGATINLTDKSGRTALHWAAIGGYAETCTFLLDNGVDLFAKTNSDMNALHAACEAQKLDVVKALFAACPDEETKAKLSAETCEGKTAWDIASAAKATPLCECLKDAGDANAASAACVVS